MRRRRPAFSHLRIGRPESPMRLSMDNPVERTIDPGLLRIFPQMIFSRHFFLIAGCFCRVRFASVSSCSCRMPANCVMMPVWR